MTKPKFEQVVVDLFDGFFVLADEGLLPEWLEVDRASKKIVLKDSGKYYELGTTEDDVTHRDRYFVRYGSKDSVSLAFSEKELLTIIKELVEIGNKVADYIRDTLNSTEDLDEVNKFTHEVASEMFGEYLSKKYGYGTNENAEELISYLKNVKGEVIGFLPDNNVRIYDLERALNDIVVDYFDEESGFKLKSKDALIHILTTIMYSYKRIRDRVY